LEEWGEDDETVAKLLRTVQEFRHYIEVNRNAMPNYGDRYPSPAAMQHAVVIDVWKGIKRTKGTAEEGKKPFLTADLRSVMQQLAADLLGLARFERFCWSASLADSGAPNWPHLRSKISAPRPNIAIRLGRSKTDQEGQGTGVPLPYGSDQLTCPVRVLRTWLEEAGIAQDRCFAASISLDL
jgi:hypothetical protein